MSNLPRYYFRDKNGYYNYSLFNYPVIWWLITIAGYIGCNFLGKKFLLNLNYFENISGIVALTLTVFLFVKLIRGVKENHGLLKYLSSLMIANDVRRALLNGMNVNRVKDAPFIEVPNVKATYQDDNSILLIVGKLVGMHDLDELSEDINSSLRGNYSKFAVVSSSISVNGINFEFYLENVEQSYRFVVKSGNISPFLSKNKHEIKLAKNLIWNTIETPMLSIVGRTRSGKTVFSEYLLKVMEKQGWKINYYSAKGDIYVRKFHGQSEPSKIVESLEKWLKIMKKRNKKIADAGVKTYVDIDLPDIALVIDEIGLLNGQLAVDAKLKKRWENVITGLMGAGASSGIHVIALSQRGTKDFFLPPSALVNARDAVIMLGLSADSGDDRRSLMPGFEIPHRAYGQGQGLARFVTSGKRWEEPNFYEAPYFEDYNNKKD
ncbi:cell division protein FtsK (plasmid) [Lactobacillus johnsonii]